MPNPLMLGIIFAVIAFVFLLFQAVRILPEYERGVVFRLGRLRDRDYGPGLFFLIPVADRMVGSSPDAPGAMDASLPDVNRASSSPWPPGRRAKPPTAFCRSRRQPKKRNQLEPR